MTIEEFRNGRDRVALRQIMRADHGKHQASSLTGRRGKHSEIETPSLSCRTRPAGQRDIKVGPSIIDRSGRILIYVNPVRLPSDDAMCDENQQIKQITHSFHDISIIAALCDDQNLGGRPRSCRGGCVHRRNRERPRNFPERIVLGSLQNVLFTMLTGARANKSHVGDHTARAVSCRSEGVPKSLARALTGMSRYWTPLASASGNLPARIFT